MRFHATPHRFVVTASAPLTDSSDTIDPVSDVEPEDSVTPTSSTLDAATPAPHTRPVPYLILVAAVAVLVPIRAAYGPIRDIDLYWHLLVGQEILDGVPVTAAARGWSFAPVPDTWVSTQWLAELTFAGLERWQGLQALVAYRTVTTVLALAVLAAVTLWRRPVRAGAWVFALSALALSIAVQERSQQLTFVLAPLVGWWAERFLRQGRLPRWWLVLPLIVVWSNFHGGWVLLPACLGLAGLARVLDHGWRDPAAWRGWLLALLCGAAACVSPSGVQNATASVRFSQSTGFIAEWQPVRPWGFETLPFVALFLLIVLAWALGAGRPTKGEALFALAVVGFGIMAWRNVTPAALILAPLATGILARALGEPDPIPRGTRAPLARLALVLALAGAMAGVLLAFRQAPVVASDVPQRLLSVVHDVPTPQRVLNTYNVSGPLLWFGGPPPHVVLGIDGRSDRFPVEYFTDYGTTLIHAQAGWEKVFDQLAPTSALLRTDEALSGVLVAQRGWVEVGREGDYVLLRAPTTTGFPAHA